MTYNMLSWNMGEARLSSFTTSGRGKVTTITLKIDVGCPHALRSLLTDIQEIQAAQSAPKRGGGNG